MVRGLFFTLLFPGAYSWHTSWLPFEGDLTAKAKVSFKSADSADDSDETACQNVSLLDRRWITLISRNT